jgi:hypothetical protein
VINDRFGHSTGDTAIKLFAESTLTVIAITISFELRRRRILHSFHEHIVGQSVVAIDRIRSRSNVRPSRPGSGRFLLRELRAGNLPELQAGQRFDRTRRSALYS